MTDAGRHVAPGAWISGDCRVAGVAAARHRRCALPSSCACRCHHRPVKIDVRALTAAPVRKLRSAEEVAEVRNLIVSVFQPGELLTTAEVIHRIERRHPRRWPRPYLSQYVSHVARSGRIVNHARGVYTLPR